MEHLPIGTKLVAGDVWGPWTVCPYGYSPADGYTLKLMLRGAKNLDLTASVSGSDFVLSATSAETAAFTAGTYRWKLAAYKDSDRTTLADGTVEILADLETQDEGVETRSWVEQALAAVRAVIAGTAGRKERQWQYQGRMLELRSMKELLEAERELAWKLYHMQIADGSRPANSGTVQIGFGAPGCSGGGWSR